AGETKQRKKALDYLIKSGVKINILQKNDLDSRIKVIEGGR
ncbi:TPA: methionine ABC transporter ATP-binding protein, partial [Enterococcus faecium]|nr:methionine ABC transporter ATP-binding protein [Enterococcus faecium]